VFILMPSSFWAVKELRLCLRKLAALEIEKELDVLLQEELTKNIVRSLEELVKWIFDHADVALMAGMNAIHRLLITAG
jgi:hypothetical protein